MMKNLPFHSTIIAAVLIALSGVCSAQNNVDPKVADRFQKYDQDQDGLVSHREFIKGPFSNKGEPRSVVDRMFKDIDRDEDGFLTLREYASAKRDRDRDARQAGSG